MKTRFTLITSLVIPLLLHGQRINSIKTFSDFNELPVLNWKYKIDAPIFSSPVIDYNMVYFGGNDSVLHAIDITTGKVKWKFHTDAEIRSSVVINNNSLYLNGGDGKIYALDKSYGKLIWEFEMEGEAKHDFADYFHCTPVLHDRILFCGSGDGNMYAINSDNGKLFWTFNAGYIIHSTPVIENGKMFFGSFDGYVYALDINNGNLMWKFKTVGHDYFPKGEVQGSPAVFGGLVFIGARDYNVYALDAEKGYCHWNKAFTRGWGLSMSIYDSVLYIGSADERVMISTDPFTGNEKWKKNMEFLIFGNNAFSENFLFVGTTIGKLHAMNLKTGDKAWSFETDSYRKYRSDYFKPDDSYRDDIYSIIKSNEEFLEAEIKLGGIFTTPAISDNFIIFTSTEGTIYCLKRK